MPFRVPSVEKILDQYYGDLDGKKSRGDVSANGRRRASRNTRYAMLNNTPWIY